MNTETDPEWSEIRIFSADFSERWFCRILQDVVVPFRERFGHSLFWFTRYRCPTDFDVAPEDLAELTKRAGFIQNNQHVSVRFRFASDAERASFVSEEIGKHSHLWARGVTNYHFTPGFSEPRFSAAQKSERARLVANLFDANCRVVLDLIEKGGGNYESNAHDLNFFMGNPGQSLLHMVANVYGRNDSSPVPLYWFAHPPIPISQC